MEDLERRLLRLRGESPSGAVTEESLRRRFRAMKSPESPCGMSHAQLAERFNKIFGSSNGAGLLQMKPGGILPPPASHGPAGPVSLK